MKESMTIHLPERWADITVGQFNRYMGAVLERKGPDLTLEIARTFSGLDDEVVEKLSFPSLAKIRSTMTEVFSKPIPEKIHEEIEIKGVKYRAPLDITALCGGQYVDMSKHSETDHDAKTNVHILCAIVYLPEGEEEYDGSTMRDRAAIFEEHMMMDVAYPIAVFFCKVFVDLMQSIEGKNLDEAEKNLKAMAQAIGS